MTSTTETATLFVATLLEGNRDIAHGMLSADLAATLSAASLGEQIDLLADDMGGIDGAGEPMVIATDWPGKKPDEMAMIYVPLLGDMFSEAVTVTIAAIDGREKVTAIEWGRP